MIFINNVIADGLAVKVKTLVNLGTVASWSRVFKTNWGRTPALLLLACATAAAGPLAVSTYTVTNGESGSFDYRDFTYSACPGNVCDQSFTHLTGGTGKLTDGVSPATSWYAEGWGTQWDGWSNSLPNPIVTFDFGTSVNLDSMTVWVDNTPSAGDVRAPDRISIGGIDFTIPADSNWGPRAYTFSGLDLIGSSVSVQFSQVPNAWLMLGEVSFAGTNSSAVPELATWLMVSGGLMVAGLIRRKRASGQTRRA